MKNHVTDSETSKKLKEAGIERESKFYHCKLLCWINKYDIRLCLRVGKGILYCLETKYKYNDADFEEVLPAYLLSELLDIAKGIIDTNLDEIMAYKVNTAIKGYLYGNDIAPLEAVAQAILWQQGAVKDTTTIEMEDIYGNKVVLNRDETINALLETTDTYCDASIADVALLVAGYCNSGGRFPITNKSIREFRNIKVTH